MEQQNTASVDRGCAVAAATRVAEKEGIDPLELPPVYEVIDVTALNRLISSADDSVEVEFTYTGHEVTVSGNGEVRVSERTSET